ncbi:MAG: DUF805 domain-containing protein [Psychrobacter sp.]|nr:DUF805 domain-containing protein [Psychrobacter sp.]
MKAKVSSYVPQQGYGTVTTENNETYTFSTARWHERTIPDIGAEVDIKVDELGNVSEISYGLLHKNYASTVPQSELIIQSDPSSNGQIEENYNMFDWFKKCLINYTNFSGRARRKEYWYFYLVAILSYIVAMIIDGILGTDLIIFLLTALGLFLPGLAVSVRRLHDVNKSGWFFFVSFIPLIGGILLLVWNCTDTDPNTNKWGRPARNV